MVEIDLDFTIFRSGIFGFVMDMFSIDSEFDIAIHGTSSPEGTVFMSSSFEGPSALITTTLETSDSLKVLFRNRNEFFSVRPIVIGDIFTSSDVLDLRSMYPTCTFPVYMQGICGACYADVVAGAGTDMVCIQGDERVRRLSPQPLVSCSNLGGCSGGSPYLAALWTADHGLYETADCPYVSSTCEPEIDQFADGCVSCKRILSTVSPLAKAYRFAPKVLLSGSEAAMRRHIESYGPVMVIFDAHSNFQEYFFRNPFGIYQSTASTPSLGNHSVRIIGFGIEDGIKYWIAINSWGSSWGDRGAFKISRGNNLCSIETYAIGLEYVGDGAVGPTSILAGSRVPAGLAAAHMHAGKWKQQDPRDPYWVSKISEWKGEILRLLQEHEFEVSRIKTRIASGHKVKLNFVGFQGIAVIIHVKAPGATEFSLKKGLMVPEDAARVEI